MEEAKDPGEFVEICLRGSSLLLLLSVVMKADWLVSRMLTTQVPSRRTANGALYLDIDVESFRIVYDILSGALILDDETLRQLNTSKGPWALLSVKTTADYLGCTSICDRIGEYEVSLKKASDAQQERIRILENHVRDLEREALAKDTTIGKLQSKLESGLENRILEGDCAAHDVRIFHCNQYRAHRRGNACGNNAVFIGSADSQSWEVTVKCPCGSALPATRQELVSKTEAERRRSNFASQLSGSLRGLIS